MQSHPRGLGASSRAEGTGRKACFVERTDTVCQGRVVTAASEIPLVMHAVDDDYFLNMHGIHNAHLIRETIPRDLTDPQPYLLDRLAKHKELAAQLRVSGPAKACRNNCEAGRYLKKEQGRQGNPQPEACGAWSASQRVR
jgi:hypothetical protein